MVSPHLAWFFSSSDTVNSSFLLEIPSFLPPEHPSLPSHPISVVFCSGSFSNSFLCLDARVPRAQSSNISALSAFTAQVIWSNMTIETLTMSKMTSPSPDLFSDQKPRCPTPLGISTWMCVQPHSLSMSKTEFLISPTPVLLLLWFPHTSAEDPFILPGSGQPPEAILHFFLSQPTSNPSVDPIHMSFEIYPELNPFSALNLLGLSPALQTGLLPTCSFFILFSAQTQRHYCKTEIKSYVCSKPSNGLLTSVFQLFMAA